MKTTKVRNNLKVSKMIYYVYITHKHRKLNNTPEKRKLFKISYFGLGKLLGKNLHWPIHSRKWQFHHLKHNYTTRTIRIYLNVVNYYKY